MIHDKHRGNAMKLIVTTTLAALATVGAGGTALADEHHSHYKDLYELKQLHVAFHAAVSHAGVDATTKAKHLADVLALWADDGVLVAGGVMYSGKGAPGEASCASGSLTLCDFFFKSRRLLRFGSRLGLADPDLYGGHQPA